jgi:hypothetical protein
LHGVAKESAFRHGVVQRGDGSFVARLRSRARSEFQRRPGKGVLGVRAENDG